MNDTQKAAVLRAWNQTDPVLSTDEIAATFGATQNVIAGVISRARKARLIVRERPAAVPPKADLAAKAATLRDRVLKAMKKAEKDLADRGVPLSQVDLARSLEIDRNAFTATVSRLRASGDLKPADEIETMNFAARRKTKPPVTRLIAAREEVVGISAAASGTLDWSGCLYGIGDPRTPGFHFCNRPAHGPWCPDHLNRVAA